MSPLKNNMKIIIELTLINILFYKLYIFIDFNIKIISRSARKYQEPLLPVSHQETLRKFGATVNRQEKNPHTGAGRLQDNSKLNAQKNPKQFSYNQNLDLSGYEADKKFIASSLQTHNMNEQVSEISNDQKKDKQNRNRQFIAKVDSINKIHDQINSLLKLVKNGESKSLIKPKQGPFQRSKTIDNLHKQRIKQQLAHRPIVQQKIQESMITPVTQKDKSFTEYRKNYNIGTNQQKNQFENTTNRLSNNYLNMSTQNLQINKMNKKLSMYQQNFHESPSKISQQLAKRLNQARNRSPKNLDTGIKNSQFPIKNPQLQKTNQINTGRNKYNYNFNSNEDPIQILKSRNFTKLRNQKQQKKLINYDYQIAKVKQRIQSSQQMTKMMEQKYLKTDQKFKNIQNQYHEQSTIHNKSKDQYKKTRVQKKSYLNISIDDAELRQNSFQIKIYPCKPTEKLNKGQICKLIAQKLSDQLKLDQKLRDARELFNDCKVPDKWRALQAKLKQFGLNFSQTQLQNQLNISSNQSNPFHDDSSKKRNAILELAETFANSQEYWEKRFCKFLSRNTIQNSGFKVSEMDLDQRGYLTVEDLVCFVNLHSSNFFRNRDMIYLFRRIMALGKNRNGVDYQNFKNIISSD